MRVDHFRILLPAVIFLACSSESTAQDWLRQAIPLEQRSHDFGAVARAANTEHRFLIKNVLDQELHISSTRASCGCTTPIVENETIQPGETGSILARFNTGSFTGQKQATLTISFDRPYFTELQLIVKGYIRRDIVVQPGEIRFDSIPEGESRQLEILVDYAGRSDWAIEGISSPVAYLSAEFEELSREAGRVRYKILADLKETAPAGLNQNQLLLLTNDRRLKSFPIRFLAEVESPIQASPRRVALGRVQRGKSVTQRLVVKGKKPFRILDISSESADVDFAPADASKTVHLVNIGVEPPISAAGVVRGTLLVQTDLQDAPLELDLSYLVEDAPEDFVSTESR